MKKIFSLLTLIASTCSLAAQNVGIGTSTPDEKLEVVGKIKTENLQMTTGAANGYVLQSDANGNAVWVAPKGSLIPFSTGPILNGGSVVSSAPIVMGFGNQTVLIIDGSGESVFPPESGGFAFTVPFTGTIHSLQISTDLLVNSVASINVTPLIYQFTILRSPSAPNNGISHFASSYLTTPLSSSVTFGGPGNPLIAGTFYSATNINLTPLAVTAGDRISIRIRTMPSSDPSASDIGQLSFSAGLLYSY